MIELASVTVAPGARDYRRVFRSLVVLYMWVLSKPVQWYAKNIFASRRNGDT